MNEIDYGEIGLLVGLEIHQELDTHKLFCNCPSVLQEEEEPMTINRELRPTQSELGEIDKAVLTEAAKSKWFRYRIHPESVCLVETDEEPPNSINREALDISLEISLLLNAKPVDEAHVMRKTVIDGSNTAGFQRTILIATGGELEINEEKIDIMTICLEEDAARKIGEKNNRVDYKLDRLGIPLIEIATGPNFTNPKSAENAALIIGQILRVTRKVKRGIGTIRQDINISIRDGARQEIKGVQELSLIPDVIELEVERQVKLLEIKSELENRGASEVKDKIFDVTSIFLNSNSKVIKKIISEDNSILAIKLPKYNGLIGRNITLKTRFGTELAQYARVYGNVKGLFHTDELPGYGISNKEVDDLRKAVEAGDGDAVIIVGGREKNAEEALKAVIERANDALKGVPEETRRALPDGTTQFMRPLPGAARMYVETDVPPIAINESELKKIREKLPELPREKKRRYIKEFNLSDELAKKISASEKSDLFEKVVNKYDINPTLVATTLQETLPYLKKKGLEIKKISDHQFEEVFAMISNDKVSKSALDTLLEKAIQGIPPEEAIDKLNLKKIDFKEVEDIISRVLKDKSDLIQEKGDEAISPLMGIVMKKMMGKADGKIVHELLEEKIKEYLSTD